MSDRPKLLPKKSKISKKSQNEKEPAAKAKEKPPDLLNPGQTIASESGHQYLVEKMLGKGGFGEVYQVSYIRHPDRKFAMKVEPNTVQKGKSFLRLKVEIHVFEAIEAASDNAIDKSHFVQMHDKGKTKTFKYYVMDLIWKSLKDVVEDVCHARLSPSTLINTARQTLAGIEALHDLGFLHRDIKAANYAVGLPPTDKLIYTMDFGIARPYRDKEGNVMVARERVAFMGTLKYASLRAQEWKEQCRKDDLEVWLYMMLELYDRDNLWWRKFGHDEQKIYDAKRKLMKNAPTMMALGKLRMPREYLKIIEHIKKLKYFDKGDFKLINSHLSNIVIDENIDESLPFDWIGKASKRRSKSTEESREGPDVQADEPVVVVEKVKRPSTKKSKENSKEKSKESSREAATREDEAHGKEIVAGSEETEVADSEENEEDRKKRKKEKKSRKRAREQRTQCSKDTSKDTSEDQDDKRRNQPTKGGPRRKNSIRKKRVSKRQPNERDENVPKIPTIPEPKPSVKEKAKVRKAPSIKEKAKKKAAAKIPEKPTAAEQVKKPAEPDKPDNKPDKPAAAK